MSASDVEASAEFPDRVRGESMPLWGVVEARRLGVEDALLGAGAPYHACQAVFGRGGTECTEQRRLLAAPLTRGLRMMSSVFSLSDLG
jgi:hypothetical protein